ncbi:MAG: hypothetical protein WBN22_01040 [Verrucomicrobiia bacterium]
MLKIFRDAPPLQNVVAGQNATCNFDVGWRYHCIRIIATVSTTNAGAAVEPTLDQAIGQIVLNVNKDPKRTHQLASHLNSIQKAWSADLAATLYSKTANDLKTAVADVAGGGNVTRTSTWVLDVWLSEPSRSTYTARQAFAWPTAWNNAAIGNYPANYTANIQAVITVPAANAGGGTLTNPAMRCEMMVDTQLGPLLGAAGSTTRGTIGADKLAQAGIPAPASGPGTPIMPISHWYSFAQTYGGTAIQIRGNAFPFNSGSLQQLSTFCQAGDDITNVAVLLDTAIRINTTKASINQINEAWGWNANYGAGTAGIDYVFADVLHMAFDFDDDPSSAVSTATFNTLEVDYTLNQAVAANKTLILAAQFYRNALLL